MGVSILAALPFSSTQLGLIVALCIIFGVIFVGNGILLGLFFARKKKRSLSTSALEQRREELLEELYDLMSKSQNPDEPDRAEEEAEDAEGADEDLEDDEDEDADIEIEFDADDDSDEDGDTDEDTADDDSDDESEDDAEDDVVPMLEGGEQLLALPHGKELAGNTEIIAVREMSALMREKLGFVGEEYDRKRYYVRVRRGFEATLRASESQVKARYRGVMSELMRMAGVGSKRSFRQERVHAGRRTIALLMFRGKTLCLALALDPTKYENTKYRGENKSDKKRFAKTPMLLRLTSARRLAYAEQLIAELAASLGSDMGEKVQPFAADLRRKKRNDLFDGGQIKISVIGEAPELDLSDERDAATGSLKILAVADMSQAMRTKFGLVGEQFDGKYYYVRYGYGFEAKLRCSSDDVKSRVSELMDEVAMYKKLVVRGSFRYLRLTYGRKTVGQILFKGKTPCIALALNPSDYAETKYRGKDMSAVKRFKDTPMLIKLSSARRLSYAKYLLNRMAEKYVMQMNESPVTGSCDTTVQTVAELFESGSLKISVVGEVPSSVTDGNA